MMEYIEFPVGWAINIIGCHQCKKHVVISGKELGDVQKFLESKGWTIYENKMPIAPNILYLDEYYCKDCKLSVLLK